MEKVAGQPVFFLLLAGLVPAELRILPALSELTHGIDELSGERQQANLTISLYLIRHESRVD